MATCLDDLNATLIEIRDGIQELSPQFVAEWGEGSGIEFRQPDPISVAGFELYCSVGSGQIQIINCSLQPASAGTAGECLLIAGLPPAARSGMQIGNFVLFSSASIYVGAIIWFNDGLSRLYSHGQSNCWGNSPSLAIGTGDTLLMNLLYPPQGVV